ncbi:MAG: aldo/keto reductase [Ruminococcaceae bacterium]|jgi:diketogulonate reductase-like aldo/keto reductase|nr:aldo/keto reductase [Oscillospiraceae bacterium]
MILEETYTLANGLTVPKIGYGTWQIPDREAPSAVRCAVETGYRHIDTAAAYGNERGVGEAVRNCGLKRDALFVTTKIPAEVKTAEGARAYLKESLALLDIGWIDLLLIHAPKPWEELHDPAARDYFAENRAVWQVMEEAVDAGLVRSIGVSNFTPADCDNILASARIKPVVNQIAVFIGHSQQKTVAYCRDNGILVSAHSPNAHGELAKNRKAAEIARRCGVSVPRLSIRWCLERGLLPLPKSTNPDHIRENADMDFVLSPEDMEELNAL